ncbi:MAG TPA: 5'/3'-nucleotidase SurE [Acidimicrobiales bacterium]|nr:5'/3'-nucleotidase SurE [Acidimicrobiales bacterium]
MRILVTNDDGIDSVGLHVLARAMTRHGHVTVAAPDSEYSGASAAFGALHVMQPEMHRVDLDGVDEAWSITGPPGLCVMFARLGALGDPFDLVIAGINPGSNVGRSVYHSGTVGAAVTARNGGIHGIAVSQAVEHWGVEGQGWEDVLAMQKWHSAAEVADAAVAGFIADPPTEPSVLNLNVPNLEVAEMAGWRMTEVGVIPPRTMSRAVRTPKPGHDGSYRVKMEWGDPVDLPVETDAGAVMHGYVSVTWISRYEAVEPEGAGSTVKAIDALLGG